MKKCFPWPFCLLIAWPYVALCANLFLIRVAMAAWLAGLLCTLVMTVLNICCALSGQGSLAAARMGVLVKLSHIPAYILCLLLTPMIWVAPPLLLMLLLTNGCMLAATSAYILRGVYLAWQEKKLSNGWAIAWAVSQCIFVLDVVGSIALYISEKRRSR